LHKGRGEGEGRRSIRSCGSKIVLRNEKLKLPSLRLSFLCAPNRAQRVACHDPTNGTGGEAGLRDFLVRVDNETGRMNNLASVFPISAYLVGVFGDFQSVADRERGAGFFHHLVGFVERIDREGDHVGIFSPKLLHMRLEVGDLPDAVGSPDAAVKNYHRVFTRQICRDVYRSPVRGRDRVVRKPISGTKLFCHSDYVLFNHCGFDFPQLTAQRAIAAVLRVCHSRMLLSGIQARPELDPRLKQSGVTLWGKFFGYV
jgi:hypothetical protein